MDFNETFQRDISTSCLGKLNTRMDSAAEARGSEHPGQKSRTPPATNRRFDRLVGTDTLFLLKLVPLYCTANKRLIKFRLKVATVYIVINPMFKIYPTEGDSNSNFQTPHQLRHQPLPQLTFNVQILHSFVFHLVNS